jgi:UDPglucose 6-dehydrogenase
LLPKCKAFSTLRIPGRAETEREWFEGPAVRRMSVASAELTKVAYNTFISTKIAVANALMEICHKTPGANVDDVTDALRAATKRVASGAYMTGGMGDGGGCHPRDNIALGWLARKLELSYDPFSAAMLAREAQSLWLVRVVFAEYLKAKAARIVVAGYAFKPGTNITAGSPALLFAAQLKEAFGVQAELWDPHVGAKQNEKRQGFHYRSNERVVLLVGCRHPEFKGWGGEGLALGSVVVDPHRTTGPSAPGVRVVRVGEGRG